jgi:nicotinamidase-related amidase
MRHPKLLDRQNTVLLIIDAQESFRKPIPDFANLARDISILVEASKILKLPVLVTEQYPDGLGKTVAEIAACLGNHQKFEKKSFSCCQQPDFVEALAAHGRKQVIVAGIEAHVCVNQTVHDLLSLEYSPHLVVEAISSRSARNKEIGIEKMVTSGAVISSLETALFELLIESGTETFKSVQRLIK